MDSLQVEELGHLDYKLSAFLKGEKFNPLAKVSKPRMINPRSPRFNLVLASYLKPLEHTLWKHWKFGWRTVSTRVSGKGLNPKQRASLIEEKMASVGTDCCVVEVDGKAFEAHVSRAQLALEHSVYKACFPGDRLLRQLLDVQLDLKGKTSGGVRFFREGCRASGDFNTGLGNTMLMGSFVIVAMQLLKLSRPWTILADGDNCLLFMSGRDLRFVLESFSGVLSSVCSHEMTIEKPAFTLENVTFGQSQPIRTIDGLTMVRDYRKVLSGCFSGYRHFEQHGFTGRLIRAISLAELSLSRGVPVLQPFFQRAAELTAGYRAVKDPSLFLEGHLMYADLSGKTSEITADARRSFSIAFGLGTDEQIRLEEKLLEALERELLPVLKAGDWLHNVEQPWHGSMAEGDNSLMDEFSQL